MNRPRLRDYARVPLRAWVMLFVLLVGLVLSGALVIVGVELQMAASRAPVITAAIAAALVLVALRAPLPPPLARAVDRFARWAFKRGAP